MKSARTCAERIAIACYELKLTSSKKGVNVRLTPSEHKFFTDASNALGKSLAVIFRQGGQEYVEKNSELRMSDYVDKDDDES